MKKAFTFAVSVYDTVKSVPEIGDKTYIFVIAAAVALAGLIVVMVWRANKNKSNDD